MFEKLTPRERKLAFAVLGLVPTALVFMVIFWFLGKYGDNEVEFQRLTTSISVEKDRMVITAISMAIQTYLVALTKQQAKIERKQVARSVVTMIGKDIRAAIQYKAADFSGMENLIATQMTMAGAPPTPEGEEPDSGIIVEDEVSFRPAMLGSESVIMMDISRLPRLDQYNPMMANDLDEVSSPSDVKSMAFFFSRGDGGIESEIDYAESRAPGGLYRREVDRAVAAFTDVVLVGEIRDLETAENAIQASLTGHLVFSTLHTNDAAGAFTRMGDMGVEPFLVASTVEGIMAQRLVRRICKSCCKQVDSKDVELPEDFPVELLGDKPLFVPVGCRECRNVGYRGRMGIYELLMTSDSIKQMAHDGASTWEIKKAAIAGGMKTLRDDGWLKVISGDTSVEEILRITKGDRRS